MTTLLFFLVLAAQPAPASDVVITPELVCATQRAIRWREPAWTAERCRDVAAAFNRTAEPIVTAAICLNESDWRPTVMAVARPGVLDVGLCGIRCTLTDGRCTNGPARGLTVRDLQDPVVNIRVASQIIEQKKASAGQGWKKAYNGGVVAGHGYAARIDAVVAALGGVVVPAKGKRARKLVRQIVDAVTRGVRS